ncbi:DUF202 domain-containing protein [Pseudomonas sp.]|mgnify:FL=1|uniref:DUF202 domain-containing protein n=1 Tax=Pseudomonas sp. TaxID=306 RepID=UPI000C97F9A7|nr:hypothetical protein [Pseudomonadales bacterium]
MSFTPPDPGLQAERTQLAWARTQLSLLLVGCLALRWLHVESGQRLELALILVCLATALWSSQQHRYRRGLRMLKHERSRAALIPVLITSGALTAVSLLALLR